jgi:DinB family protein
MEAWLDRLRSEIEETTQGLGAADWSRAPQGRWNTAQILEHLGYSYGATAKMLESSLAAGAAPQVRAAKLSERWKQLLVVRLGYFPSGRKAPAFIVPHDDAGPDVLGRALSGLERMKVALAAAEERWGSRKPVGTHFVLGPMNPGQWRKFHYLHGHHHVLQMRERLGDSVANKAVG